MIEGSLFKTQPARDKANFAGISALFGWVGMVALDYAYNESQLLNSITNPILFALTASTAFGIGIGFISSVLEDQTPISSVPVRRH